MSVKRQINSFLKNRRCTLLGVGPMSQNCVDATIELANEYSIPIMLVASRRQIEAAELGGGYVNGWSTEKYAQYVIENDKRGNVILARDHGGLWQNPQDCAYSYRKAMEVAKHSFQVDIESGFEIIHIDPSVDVFGRSSVDEILERIFELYEFCYHVAQKNNREVLFEVGTEEQQSGTADLEQFEYVIAKITNFCDSNRLPRPTFIVAQTGSKVMETRNVGSFDSPYRVERELPIEIQLPRLLEVCQKHEILIKEHNTDYMSDETLSWHPKLGIHAANVAPEFGVCETRAFLCILEKYKLNSTAAEFLEIAFKSRKWEKWMLPCTFADDRQKAIIAGHYVFSHPQVVEIKQEATQLLERSGLDLDQLLKNEVKKSICRYLKLFNLVAKK